MCASLELNDSQVLPGKAVAVWLEEGHSAWLAWVGFSRAENLARWLGMGAQLVDLPATRFAIRSPECRTIAWEEVPLGMVVRGLVDSNSGKPLLKVVTRPSTAAEMKRLGHARMPVIELPRVSAERILPPRPMVERTLMVERSLFAR
jgi:hypothetical protein